MTLLKNKFQYVSIMYLFLLGMSCSALAAENKEFAQQPRYQELKEVINQHTGFAHLTRGMNRYTIEALRNKVTEADIPVLKALTEDEDNVTRMTATEVLLKMGIKHTPSPVSPPGSQSTTYQHYQHSQRRGYSRILPADFMVYVNNNTVINHPSPGFQPTILKTVNQFLGNPGGYIACYSHINQGSAYGVGGDIYVMGQIRLPGNYQGRIFQPEHYEGKDISQANEFKMMCSKHFPACQHSCWAGGDTGGWGR
ncbi:MAG: hypothetical protein V4525_01930 [Pseudomonadota bacterium]